MYFIEVDDGSDDDQNGKELCENEDTAQEKRSVLSCWFLLLLPTEWLIWMDNSVTLVCIRRKIRQFNNSAVPMD